MAILMAEQQFTAEQQRLLSLLEYLEELEKLHRRPIFHISEHGSFVAFQQDVVGLPGIETDAVDRTGPVWMEIHRLRAQRPPPVPELLIPWVSVRDDPTSQPSCREVILESPDREIRIADRPEAAAAFEDYLKQWQPWSESELPRRKTIALYDKLFNVNQALETEGTESPTELVWGIGVAVWSRGRNIQHPLLTQLVEIDRIGTLVGWGKFAVEIYR